MTKKIFMTRRIPARAEEMFREMGYQVTVSEKDGVLTRDELKEVLAETPYDAVASLLTDAIDADMISAMPESVKIIPLNDINFAIPPIFWISSTPGRRKRTNAFEIIAFAPISQRSPEEICLTAVFVATGIKKGVSIFPDFVESMPTRAFVFLSLYLIENTFSEFLTI